MRVLAVFIVAISLLGAPALARSPKVGQPAPEFRITTFDGREIALSDLKGQVVVLNFWATWCGPCKRELPLLDSYFQAQRAHGMAVLAVTTEDSVPLSRLKPLAANLALSMARRMRGPYGPIGDAVPTNFVIDRAGVLRYAKAGAFTLDDLNETIVPLLREPAPQSAEPPPT